MLGFDQSAFADDHGAFQRVAQLAHIARPGVSLEHIQHGLAHVRHFAIVLLVHVREQALDQVADIFFMLAQRRHIEY